MVRRKRLHLAKRAQLAQSFPQLLQENYAPRAADIFIGTPGGGHATVASPAVGVFLTVRTFLQDSQRTVQKPMSLVIDLLRKPVAAGGVVSQEDPKRQARRAALDMDAHVLGIGGAH
jgi:hypothetical protein